MRNIPVLCLIFMSVPLWEVISRVSHLESASYLFTCELLLTIKLWVTRLLACLQLQSPSYYLNCKFSEHICFNFLVFGTPLRRQLSNLLQSLSVKMDLSSSQAVQVHSISQCGGPPARVSPSQGPTPPLPWDGREGKMRGGKERAL